MNSVAETQAVCREAKRQGRRIGFVPTMGALHEGHLSLVRAARTKCDFVVASVFVNPLQFGPSEDFGKYPRTFEHDRQLLEAEGVSLLFAPTSEEMYPAGAITFVEVEGLPGKLEGRTRPGHFRGVTTVVTKLFNIVQPELAFLGQKDAQQAVIISKMVADLNMDVEVVVCPTVREPDGLAKSSRNVYLDVQQRRSATALYRALMRIRMLVDQGERSATTLLEAGGEVISEEPDIRLDYLEIVSPESLDAVSDVSGGALVVIAAYLGKTRLIDNLVL